MTTVYTPEKGRIWHPQALGDGRTVRFTHIHPPGRDPVVGGASAMVSDLRLLDRQTGEVRPLLENALAGRLLTDGTLIFARDEALWAVRVDMAALRTLGTPVRAVQRVRVESAYASQLAVAQDGTLVYLAGSVAGASQKRLLWLTGARSRRHRYGRRGRDLRQCRDSCAADRLASRRCPRRRDRDARRRRRHRRCLVVGRPDVAAGRVDIPLEGQSSLSPDERWLTYGSDESGEMQVYVQPFPGPGPRQQVPGPGWMPVWSRNGRELLYLRGGPPTDVMGAQVHADAGASLLRVGPPESLAAYLFYERRTTMRLFDAPASGDRLIFITRSDEVTDDERHLRVVLNWTDELRRQLSNGR